MALDIVEDREGDVVVLAPVGRLDTSTSRDFERHALELLGKGDIHYVVDFAQLEYVSSAGLRVLLMLAKRLPGMRGTLVLCGMSPQVLEVFEIAGFSKIFTIVPNRPHALSETEKLRTGGKAPKGGPRGAKPAAEAAAKPAAVPAAQTATEAAAKPAAPPAAKPAPPPAAKPAAPPAEKPAAPPAEKPAAVPAAKPAAVPAAKPAAPPAAKPAAVPAAKPAAVPAAQTAAEAAGKKTEARDEDEAVEELAVELLRKSDAPSFLEE